MNKLKFISALIVLGGLLSCSKITQKVEEKVDEKVNKTIEKNMRKIDSTFSKEKLDSLKKQIDSLSNENTQKTNKTKKQN